jgi:glycosyltransferase involved in cell wall biosynthesis
MKTSIIIPTYNEASVIGECLKSLSGQSYRDFEVIVVDDGSTDNTWKILSEIRNSKFEIRKLHGTHTGAGSARNFGAKHAKGGILVFVDADMTFDKNFLSDLIKPIEEGKSKGTFSKNEYVSNWSNAWARCWNINEGWEEKKRHPKSYPDHQSVFRAILRSEFDKVGGFTPGGYDDDWSLSKKLGYEAVAVPGAVFYHKNPLSLAEIYKHAKWVSKRTYKFGIIGYLVALVRSSFPVSLCVGLYKSFVNFNLQFTVFKVIYDFGIFVGIGEILIYKRFSK